MHKIESLLRQAIGLDCASIGVGAVQRAVHERRRMCLLPDAEAYWERLSTSEAELQELIEMVVVPETWFFRDRGAFSALANMARSVWLRNRPNTTLRLLSLPCASGEEPYSMSMALLDEGVPQESFRIDAVDVSARAVEKGRQATYGRNSFRGAQLQFRERYFECTGATYRLSEAVRAPVRFERGNLFAPDFRPDVELYDAIFCRNVLIYFDRAAQTQAVAVLARLLKPAGALFVAPAETSLLHGYGFSPMHWPRAFAFRKGESIVGAHTVAAARPLPPAAPVSPSPLPTLPSAPPAPIQPAAAQARPELPIDAQQAAAAIAVLADRGELDEAAEACALHQRSHGPSPQILYLLGLIRDAGGRTAEAVQYYRQTLYLQPTHREALTHLALLLDKQGDASAAQLLRGRINRLEQAYAERS
ncbi:CheR family methyltransferase [Nevskia soli]|uniref:CheR family methyltransferase n=1 Tax=Nevskia soli TaxID=418856 RepID=UPI001B808468|nr:CheR family methyltransferase [Nevskia soli]